MSRGFFLYLNMKQLLLSVLLILLGSDLTGQVNATVDILAGYNSTYRLIDGNGSMTEQTRNDLELRKGTTHLGFNFNKRLSDKVYFKTGARYLTLGYKTKETELVFGDDMTTTNIYFTYDYQFIEVPLNVRFELFKDKTIVPYFELGVSTMYLFGNVQVLYENGMADTRTRRPIGAEFNKLHLAMNVNGGFNYFLSGGGTCLYLQGLIRYDFTNLVDSDNFKEFLYGYGLEVGVRRVISSGDY